MEKDLKVKRVVFQGVKKMTAPSISVYINLEDSDVSPNWINLDTLSLYWCRTGTSASTLVPMPRRVYNQWIDELWVAETPYANGQKVSSYHTPADSVQRAKVLKVSLDSGTLSDVIDLTAFDDETHSSTDAEVFGTPASDNTSWIKAIPTGGSLGSETLSVPSPGWCTFNTSNSVAPGIANELNGDSRYVYDTLIPDVGQEIYFALAHLIPYDASAGWHTIVLTVRYKWTE